MRFREFGFAAQLNPSSKTSSLMLTGLDEAD